MAYKICSRCGFEQDLGQFQKRKASKDGHTAACRSCLKEYDRGRTNFPHRMEARAAYQKTEKGKESANKAKKKFIDSNPIKRKAHSHVGNFLRDGKLVRPGKCENCGNECKPHAHHCDYTKPLEVMWLCKACHVDWHKRYSPTCGEAG